METAISEEINKLVQHCIDTNSDTLDLSYIPSLYSIPLPDLPEVIKDIPNLRNLIIHNTYINLPSWISDIKPLETLDVGEGVCVSQLLPHLHKMEKLRVLRYGDSEVTDVFPDKIENLQALEDLYIDGMELMSLPEGFSSLKNLEKFHIKYCRWDMKETFKILSKLPKLKILNYDYEGHYNDNSSYDSGYNLPESFTDCQHLEEIYFDFWPTLNCLPDNIDKMQSLRVIDISNTDYFICDNIINGLPESLGNLKNLEKLDLFACVKITKLPENFKNITTLKAIDVMNSGIDNLSLTEQQWHNLEYLRGQGENLDLVKCPNLKTFAWLNCSFDTNKASSLSYLHNLEDLWLIESKLAHTNFFRNMPQLKNLNFQNCAFDNLSEFIGEMEDLEEISISYNLALTRLPESLAKSKSLKKIRLDWTGITEIPDFLKSREDIEIIIVKPHR